MIDCLKIEFIKGQLLEETNKNIITFFRRNELTESYNKIIEDLFEENGNFENLSIG